MYQQDDARAGPSDKDTGPGEPERLRQENGSWKTMLPCCTHRSQQLASCADWLATATPRQVQLVVPQPSSLHVEVKVCAAQLPGPISALNDKKQTANKCQRPTASDTIAPTPGEQALPDDREGRDRESTSHRFSPLRQWRADIVKWKMRDTGLSGSSYMRPLQVNIPSWTCPSNWGIHGLATG